MTAMRPMRLFPQQSALAAAAAVFLVALLWSAPSHAAESWNKIQSKNFVIVGEVGYGRLAAIAETLEDFRLATTRIFPGRVVQSSRPLTVVVVEPGHMKDYGPGRSGNVGGYYMSLPDRDYIVMVDDWSGDFRTTLHEYQHSIVRNTWQHMPRWVNEGIAEFYSTFRSNGDGSRYEIGRPVSAHIQTLNVDGNVSLDKFLTDDGRSMRMEERVKVGIFYAESWALVHFFLLGDEGKWAPTFDPFVQALAAGEEPVAAFRRTVTPDIGMFQARFRAYITRRVFPFANYLAPPETAEALGTSSMRGKLSVAETETLRARLFNDADKSKRAIEEALNAEPNYRPALSVRAELLLLRDRDTSTAAEELSTLVRADAGDVRLCGLAMFALNALSRSEQALTMCSENNGFDASTAFERAVALESLGHAADAAPLYANVARAGQDALTDIYWRAWRYLESGAYLASIRATDLAIAQASNSPDSIGYLRFVRTVDLCLLKQCDVAQAELKKVGIPEGAGEWVQAVFQFQTGALAADALMKKANRKEEETEAHAYVALDLFARGRTAEALPHFKWVVDRGSQNVSEYFVARAHYMRLTAR